ncbi:MAG TPA: polysaccharide deacetylase family protein [Candidatus Sulfotelmatobacter sp.]|nr:polysaccharide deacetylase family protein [Candidatus Sulfotelmatobacter sp.]
MAAVAAAGIAVLDVFDSGQDGQTGQRQQAIPVRTGLTVIQDPNEPARTVLAQFQHGHGFQDEGGAAQVMDDTADHVIGGQSVYIETQGRGIQAIVSKPSALATGFDMRGKVFAVLIKVTNAIHLTKLSFIAGSAGFKNYFQFMIQASPTIPSQEIFPEGNWSWVTIPWVAGSSGNPDRADITDLRLTATDDNSGKRVKVQIQAIAAQAERPKAFPNGVVSISFDDCWGSQGTLGLPYLDKNGFRPTIYTIVDQVGRPGRLSLSQLQAIEDKGGEVAAHAWTAANHNAGFTNLSADELDEELSKTKSWLLDKKFRGADLFAYPLGEFDSAVLNAASNYYKFARTLNNRQEETLPPGAPYTGRAQSSTNTVTLSHLKDRIDSCQVNGTWLNLVFHDITSGIPSASVQIADTTFYAAIDYLSHKGIPVQTTSEILEMSL